MAKSLVHLKFMAFSTVSPSRIEQHQRHVRHTWSYFHRLERVEPCANCACNRSKHHRFASLRSPDSTLSFCLGCQFNSIADLSVNIWASLPPFSTNFGWYQNSKRKAFVHGELIITIFWVAEQSSDL